MLKFKFLLKPVLLLLLSTLLLSSCASIVSKSRYPVSINSAPNESKIVITDKKGAVVFSGQTPVVVELKSGAGFFTKAQYQITLSKIGYQDKIVPLNYKLDGWYFGNILLGGIGLLGIIAIDPATGAMFKIDNQYLNETLIPLNANTSNENLKIFAYNDIPEEWKENLIEIE